jgi:phosphatidate cytidylyltransferase
VWAADIGAYFAGRRFGKRKLAPAVSPGKSWEGALGGLACALLVSLTFAYALAVPWGAPLLLFTVLVAVLSIFGDLFESVLKRTAGVKDSGGLLPGHGGVLDRLDALLPALPLAALGLGALPSAG